MSKADRWLLPDGIEEILPEEALFTETLRRKLVDLFQTWGYDYVIPPMVEFTDSLLTGSGQDIDLLTFKVTDQMSGKMLGIRSDITPQAARMDAHSLYREGVNRLCYAGHVMHTRPKGAFCSRTPVRMGVELFGDQGIEADLEVMSLLLQTLIEAEVPGLYIDLGHVNIYRSLAGAIGLTSSQEQALFSLLQSKAAADIRAWVTCNISDETHQQWMLSLAKLSGDASVIAKARAIFVDAPEGVKTALDELEYLHSGLSVRFPNASLYFDLSELRGYNYHTGIVFGAFAPGMGASIARGGRYDHVGEAFGRARPATGFDLDLNSIARHSSASAFLPDGVFTPSIEGQEHWAAIQCLRADGERVVVGESKQTLPNDYQRCDRILKKVDDRYTVLQLADAELLS